MAIYAAGRLGTWAKILSSMPSARSQGTAEHWDPLPVRGLRQRREPAEWPTRRRRALRGRGPLVFEARSMGHAFQHPAVPRYKHFNHGRHFHAADRALARVGAKNARLRCGSQPGHLRGHHGHRRSQWRRGHIPRSTRPADPAHGRQKPPSRPRQSAYRATRCIGSTKAMRPFGWAIGMVRLGCPWPSELYDLKTRPHGTARPGHRQACTSSEPALRPSGMPWAQRTERLNRIPRGCKEGQETPSQKKRHEPDSRPRCRFVKARVSLFTP